MKNDENYDVLEVKGILSKGYGIISKALMLDPNIPLTSKVLLGYICSFTGSGTSAFPGRDRITSDLGIDKDTFSKYLKVLTATGIVSVRQENRGGYGRGFCHNVYTVNIDSYLALHMNDDSALRVSETGLLSSGYGLAPKLVMQARELTVQAKGIYLYLSVFANGDSTASPSLESLIYHLGISRKTYQRHMKNLTDNNYVTVLQRHSATGRMGSNEYVLSSSPGKLSTPGGNLSTESRNYAPCAQISDTQNPPCTQISDTQMQPCAQISDTQILPCGQISDTQISDTIITSSEKTTVNDLSINKRDLPVKGVIKGSMDNAGPTDAAERYYLDHFKETGRELFEKEKIPAAWSGDPDRLMTAVRVLTEWDDMEECYRAFEAQPDADTDLIQGERYVYRLFAEALTDLLRKSDIPTTMLGQEILYPQIYARLSEWYEYDPKRRRLTLTELRRRACESYPVNDEEADIRNPLAYMKSCIWSLLREGQRHRAMRPPGRNT